MNKLEMIHKIKEYKEPPYTEDDPYYLRYPWTKFGTVSSGIYVKWYWYNDEAILQKTTAEDIIKAYKEIKGEDNMETMFEEVKNRSVVLSSGDGDSQRFFRTVKDFVDFLNLPAEEEKLDDIEKRYIKDFIRPFRDKIVYIQKIASSPTMGFFGQQYPTEQIEVTYKDSNYNKQTILLPPFSKNSMYKGMKLNKQYTLEGLKIKFGN